MQDLTEDRKVLLANILTTSCQEFIKNFARYSHDPVGIYIQDLRKILKRSHKILSIFVLKYDLSRSRTNFLLNILKIACLELKNLAKSSLYLAGIQI